MQQPFAAASDTLILDAEELQRVLWRLSRELQERHPKGEEVALCGIVTRGVHLACRLQRLIAEQSGATWPAVSLDVGPYRDDFPRARDVRPAPAPVRAATRAEVEDRLLVLVDDVLYHGRTARAALVALAELGRPRAVELLVLVDRGHRELPLRATFVGKNLPTGIDQMVRVRLLECDGQDSIWLQGRPRENQPT